MKWILPLLRNAEHLYLKWALAEMNPLHPDLPKVVTRINQLESTQ